MSKTVNIQDVIDLLLMNREEEHKKSLSAEYKHKSVIRSKHDAHVAFCDYLIECVERLPSVQPERCEDCENFSKTRLLIPQPEIIRCKDCEYWRQQTNYAGTPLSFGFCESDDMWRSLYGETTEVAHIDTDDNHYCSYAERRLTDG